MSDGALTLFDGPRRAGRPRKMSVAAQWTESLRGADHLQNMDRALMELGRLLAAKIDATDDVKELTGLAGQLIGVIDRLGLSPRERRRSGADTDADGAGVNPLDDLRLIRASRRNAQVDAGS